MRTDKLLSSLCAGADSNDDTDSTQAAPDTPTHRFPQDMFFKN